MAPSGGCFSIGAVARIQYAQNKSRMHATTTTTPAYLGHNVGHNWTLCSLPWEQGLALVGPALVAECAPYH